MANLFQLLLAQIHPRQGRPAGEPERAEGYKTHPKRESNNKVRETRVLEGRARRNGKGYRQKWKRKISY